ncbi:hypothetical protein LCGC14_0174270 [marine sediment metagenome]|uniref:Uncharacterized protein n=1 Tax=marine sediment metagenome TaxID=412755 RepID=A0A0F9UUY3_9ZZZZ
MIKPPLNRSVVKAMASMKSKLWQNDAIPIQPENVDKIIKLLESAGDLAELNINADKVNLILTEKRVNKILVNN